MTKVPNRKMPKVTKMLKIVESLCSVYFMIAFIWFCRWWSTYAGRPKRSPCPNL